MTAEQVIAVLRIELLKAQSDFYPDRRIALETAIEAVARAAKEE